MSPRRKVAVALFLPLAICFSLGLAGGRLDATLLNPRFVNEQAHDLRLAERLHEDGTRRIVRDILDHPERRPANLRDITLPTDQHAEDRLTALLQSFLPPELIEHETAQVIEEVLPWLAGKSDHFAIDLSLHDGLAATFGHPTPGQPSLFEQTWRDLDMGQQVVLSIARAYDNDPSNAGKPIPGAPPGVTSVTAAVTLRGESAGAWFDEQWFTFIDEAVPYLAGETEQMDAGISFVAFPFLAPPFAKALHLPPEQVTVVGWRLTDADLKKQLSKASNPALSRADNTVAIFTPEGGTLTDADLVARYDQQRERSAASGEPVDGPTIMQMRTGLSLVRMAGLYGAPLLCLALVVAIALLASPTWPVRVAWGGAAILVAAAIGLVGSTVIYNATISSPLDSWVARERTRPAGRVPTDLRVDVAEQARTVMGEQADRTAFYSSVWLVIGMGALAGGLVWEPFDRRRASRAHPD